MRVRCKNYPKNLLIRRRLSRKETSEAPLEKKVQKPNLYLRDKIKKNIYHNRRTMIWDEGGLTK